jgi:hypothetical protein
VICFTLNHEFLKPWTMADTRDGIENWLENAAQINGLQFPKHHDAQQILTLKAKARKVRRLIDTRGVHIARPDMKQVTEIALRTRRAVMSRRPQQGFFGWCFNRETAESGMGQNAKNSR